MLNQSEKAQLNKYGYNVYTVHEYQGKQAAYIVVVRLTEEKEDIYNSLPHPIPSCHYTAHRVISLHVLRHWKHSHYVDTLRNAVQWRRTFKILLEIWALMNWPKINLTLRKTRLQFFRPHTKTIKTNLTILAKSNILKMNHEHNKIPTQNILADTLFTYSTKKKTPNQDSTLHTTPKHAGN